jgi:hypothetical protein
MITFKIYQNLRKVIPGVYFKWYARPVVEETVDMEGPADHMANHNSPYSKGVFVGILTIMWRASRSNCSKVRTSS